MGKSGAGKSPVLSLISGLDALIEEKTGITTMIAEEPLTAVAIGTGKFIEFAHGGKGAEK